MGLLLAAPFLGGPTWAATTDASMIVSATVVARCTIVVRPAGVTPLVTTCTRGQPYSVQLQSNTAPAPPNAADQAAKTVTATILF